MLPDLRFLAKWAASLARNTDRTGGPDACWPWLRSRGRPPKLPYGRMVVAGHGWRRRIGLNRIQAAHRVAWALANGRFPRPDEFICHTCDNPPCCNDRHLFLGDAAVNGADAAAKGRLPSGVRSGMYRKRQGVFDERRPAEPPPSPSRGRRLTQDDVRAIRAAWKEGGQTQRDLAARYGCARSLISHVVTGRRWSGAC